MAWSTCPTSRGSPPAKTSSATSRRATRSKPWFSRSIRSASAFRSASSSSSRIRSASSWPRNPKGSIVNGTVKEVDAKGATIDLGEGVEGYLRANDIAKERVDDATQHLKVGDKVEAKYIGMDRKGRVLQLSIRAKDEDEMQQALEDYQSRAGGTTKLGALLKEQMNKSRVSVKGRERDNRPRTRCSATCARVRDCLTSTSPTHT